MGGKTLCVPGEEGGEVTDQQSLGFPHLSPQKCWVSGPSLMPPARGPVPSAARSLGKPFPERHRQQQLSPDSFQNFPQQIGLTRGEPWPTTYLLPLGVVVETERRRNEAMRNFSLFLAPDPCTRVPKCLVGKGSFSRPRIKHRNSWSWRRESPAWRGIWRFVFAPEFYRRWPALACHLWGKPGRAGGNVWW